MSWFKPKADKLDWMPTLHFRICRQQRNLGELLGIPQTETLQQLWRLRPAELFVTNAVIFMMRAPFDTKDEALAKEHCPEWREEWRDVPTVEEVNP